MDLLFARLEGTWVFFALVFGLGTLIGSFLNVVIGRLPAGESIVRPGSRCPKCGVPIRPHHNVPILSWLWLRGRCAACEAQISARYPMVELVTGCLFMAAGARFGVSFALLASLAFIAALVVVAFIDLDIWEIPDEITVPGTAIAVILRPLAFDVPWWSGLVGASLGAAFILGVRWLYFAWRGVEAMGLGDVKLIALIGGFLGAGALLPTITLGSLVGAAVGGAMLLAGERRSAERSSDPALTPPSATPAPGDAAPAAGTGPASSEADDEPPAWARPPSKLRIGLVARWRGRRAVLGLPPDMAGRTHVRVGWLMGRRGRAAQSGMELLVGLFQDVPGWGHFEGLTFGHPPRLWLGPVLGARTPEVEVFGDDEPWEPPRGALPFGPFLALGALATLLLSPLFGRWATILGLS